MRDGNFADWRLRIDGLVANPLEFSLADLRNLPQRTQITRHDCVEGWSAIGKWQGVPLAIVLARATFSEPRGLRSSIHLGNGIMKLEGLSTTRSLSILALDLYAY